MGVTQDKLVFRQTRTTCIHSYTHYCVYKQGVLHTGGISGVFLVNLKKLVKCTIKKRQQQKKDIHFHQSNAALTCLFQPYVLAFDGVVIQSRDHTLF